jgi:hypothetical protein
MIVIYVGKKMLIFYFVFGTKSHSDLIETNVDYRKK